MLLRTSTYRSKLAVSAMSVALVAGILATPAAADSKSRRLLPHQDAAGRSATVEQRGQAVNLGAARSREHSGQPVWAGRKPGRTEAAPGRHARAAAPPPQFRDRDRARGRRHMPPPMGAAPAAPPEHASDRHRRRHGDRHDRHDRHRHNEYRYEHNETHVYYRNTYNYGYRRPAPRVNYYYSYYYARPMPYPVYLVPYHTHPHGHQGHAGHDHGQQAQYCSDGPSHAGRYVAGGSHQPGGMIVGGILGAAVGSQVGKGQGQLVAVGVGTLLGALIGKDVGRSLDVADQAYATGAFGQAMEAAPTCSTITWNNPGSGSAGSVMPTRTYEIEPGRYCREYQQQVVIGGRTQDAYGTACRQPDGSWEIVTE